MGDKGGKALNNRGSFRSPFLSVRIQEQRSDDEDTVIDVRGANGAGHPASSSGAGIPDAGLTLLHRSRQLTHHSQGVHILKMCVDYTAGRFLVSPCACTGTS